MTLEEEIIAQLEQCKNEIVANMAAKNINASGRTSQSFRVRVNGNDYELVVGNDNKRSVTSPFGNIDVHETAPLFSLEKGHAPGDDVPKGFMWILRQWSIEKGISFANDNERNTFAYFLSKKIKREGTQRFKKNEDVYTIAVNNAKERIQQKVKENLSYILRAAVGNMR